MYTNYREGRDSKMKCDGYNLPDNNQVIRKKVSGNNARIKNVSMVIYPPALTFLNPDLPFGSGPAMDLFHHFRTCAITDLALLPHSAKFWDHHVLPLSHAVPAVQCAAIALGAAHRVFLLKSWDDKVTEEIQHLETFAVKQYNRAIKQLLAHMSFGSSDDIWITIVCCLLFYCLENVERRAEKSLPHLQAGVRLLLSLRSSCDTKAAPFNRGSEGAVSEMANMFARLGVDASLYSGQIVPDLSSLRMPATDIGDDPLQPFPDLDVARNVLWDIDVDLNAYYMQFFPPSPVTARKWPADGDSNLPCIADVVDNLETIPCHNTASGPIYNLEMQVITNRFRRWSKRFNRTIVAIKKRGPNKREWQEMTMLVLRQRLWETSLDEVQSGDPDLADSILDQAELLVHSLSLDRPIFTLESSIMSATSFVCFYSDEKRHRIRAWKILRSARMREGVWDSNDLARNIEIQFPDIEAELHNLGSTTASPHTLNVD